MIPIGTAPGSGDFATPDGFVDVLAVEELPPSSQKSVSYRFTRILLCNTGADIFAVEDLCPHALQPLAGSEITGGTIRCSKHGAQFALATGQPRNGVTAKSLRVYPVRLRNGRIEIDVTVQGRLISG
jgi:3-phenylpropionate/trans-cinnamate dioxygenase ferredoxin subunit